MRRKAPLIPVVLLVFAVSGMRPLSAEEPGDPAVAAPEPGVETKKKKKKFPDVDVGGEIEIEYVDTQVERDSTADRTEYPAGRLQLDFASVTVKASLAKDIFGRFEARFRPMETIDVQEAIFRLEGLPLKGFLQVGLDSRIVKPRRKTESYPLAGTAFWKGKELSLQGGLDWKFLEIYKKKEPLVEIHEELPTRDKKIKVSPDFSFSLVFEVSVGNGMPLGKRPLGEDPSFRILGYEELNLDFNEGKELGLALGVKGRLFSLFRFDVTVFGYASKLTDEDRELLWDLPGYGTWESRDHYFLGYSGRLRFKGATLFGHLCFGRLGRLGRAAWYVQASYKFEWKGISFLDMKFLRTLEPVFRYGVLDVDMVHDPSDALTWNRDRITLALITDLVKDVKLKLEYVINGEATGGGSVKNDEFIAQIEVRF